MNTMTVENGYTPCAADALLADGSIVNVRPLSSDDESDLLALNAEVGLESLRFRFFAANRSAAEQYARHLLSATDVPALVAVHEGELVGVASAEPTGPQEAEVAFLVAESWHGRGVGSLLLEHLAAWARDRGVECFVADVLLENHRMLEVFANAGFATTRTTDSGVAHLELNTAESARALLEADRRESASERESLRGLLHPRSIAVYGARRDGTGIGAAVLRSIRDGGFTGPTYVVHPAALDFAGARTVRSLAQAKKNVDLAVLALPADRVLASLSDVAKAGTGVAVLIGSGFAEMGEDGAALQRDILNFARSHDIRLVGPNCLGVAINDGKVRLDATFGPRLPAPGGLAIASQSGGVGIALIDQARILGLGVGAFISLGNKCDVSGNDLLAAWMEDSTVDAVALYLESFGNASKFSRIARRFAQRKPLLAVVGGQSTSGHRAGQSHTAAAATPSAGVSALFKQAGVIGCADLDELTATALLVTKQPLPRGPRVAILSNAGGIGCLAADTAERAGLVVPELGAATSAELGRHVQRTVGISNPIDAGAGVTPQDFQALAHACLVSDDVDALLVIVVATAMNDGSTLAHALEGLRTLNSDKPVVLIPMGGLQQADLEISGIAIEPTVPVALRALAGAVGYAQWRAFGKDDIQTADAARATRARALAATIADSATGRLADGWLGVADTQAFLAPYHLAPLGQVATRKCFALRAAESVGYPLAVKAADGQVVHKTDQGLVRTDIRGEADLRQAIEAFSATTGRDDFPVLVQPIVAGAELALGMVRDPGFGPVLMVGAGGVTTDLIQDRAFLIPPFSRDEAQQALESLRLWPMLAGYRGSPALDTNEILDTMLRLAQLTEEVPEVVELDMNPLVVSEDQVFLIDVKVRLGAAGVDAGVPRRLRDR